MNSFRDGGNQTRLLLVDASPEDLASCIQVAAVMASVGDTPAGPKSSTPFASPSDVDAALVPHFKAAMLVRQRTEADADCTEPVVAVTPLTVAVAVAVVEE